MRRSRKPITIASRRSDLAQHQAKMVRRGLSKLHPNIEVRMLWVESEGDEGRAGGAVTGDGVAGGGVAGGDVAGGGVDGTAVPGLSGVPMEPGGSGVLGDTDAGGGLKGLFTRAIDAAVLDGRADLAVHSLKDLPTGPTPGLARAATTRRADARDALVSAAGFESVEALPEGAVVGTGSPRRAAQLLRVRPDLRIKPLRGNVPTRLAKVLEPDGAAAYDAVVVAMAALRRLKLTDQPHAAIPVETMCPAAGQGSLAVHCRIDDHVSLTRCLPLNDAPSSTTTSAERELVAALNGDCHSPIAVLVEVCESPLPVKRNADAHWYRLRARVLNGDGTRCLEFDDRCRAKELRRLIKDAAAGLIEQGAHALLAEARTHSPLRVGGGVMGSGGLSTVTPAAGGGGV